MGSTSHAFFWRQWIRRPWNENSSSRQFRLSAHALPILYRCRPLITTYRVDFV
jgi:hypothetical protein